MSKPRLRRPSTGTVLGGLALIVAVAGNANAFSASHIVVRKGDIAKGAVTAKALAKNAVTAKAVAKGAVGPKAIKAGAVTAPALGADSVTASAIAPGSVYGGALGSVSFHSTPVADLDSIPENVKWTASARESVMCGPGERFLSGGVTVTDLGNEQVAVTTAVPFANGSANGFVGQIMSNSGGTAKGEVQVYCLK